MPLLKSPTYVRDLAEVDIRRFTELNNKIVVAIRELGESVRNTPFAADLRKELVGDFHRRYSEDHVTDAIQLSRSR